MAARVDHAARRLKIAECATELFSKRGYDNVSLGDVAAAAGVARTVLYRDFHSKREVLDEAIFAHTRAIVARCVQVVAGPATLREKIVGICGAAADHLADQRAFLTAIFDFALAGFRRGEDMGAQVYRFTWRTRQTLEELFAAGKRSGAFATSLDAAAAADALMALLESFTLRLAFGMAADPAAFVRQVAVAVRDLPGPA